MSTTKFIRFPWATSGDKAAIPDTVQPSGTVSYPQGFGPDYERDPATDPLAKRVPRDETNQLYFDVTENVRAWQLAGLPEWVTSAQNGGMAVSYPLNAMVRHDQSGAFLVYQSIVDANTAEPGTDATKWVATSPSIIQSGAWTYAVAGGTANALTLALEPALPAYAAGQVIVVNAISANTRAAVTINVNGLGTRSIVRRGGGALRRGDIQPGPMILIDNGTKYELFGAGGSSRTLLTANLTLYVSTTGSNSNDGLDPAAAFQTIQRAWSEIVNNYDLNGFVATIQIADGTYTSGVSATSGPIGGNAGTGSVIIQGNLVTPSNVLVATSGSDAFLAQGGAQYTIRKLKVQTSGANNDCITANPGGLITHDGVEFGGCGAAHLNALGGFISAASDYSITSASVFHASASAFGKITANGVTVTLISTPSFSGAFARSEQGRVESIGNTYVGAATGKRYDALNLGLINTNGGGATALPGSIAGTTATGGQYV